MKKARTIRRATLGLWLSTAGAASVLTVRLASNPLAGPSATVTPLMTVPLAGSQSKELSMVTVEYGPGGSTPVHTHHAQALLYVLEGSVVMQIRGAEPITLSPGQTWYEGPNDVHVVSRNASSSASAKYVVFMVKDKGAPILKVVE